MKKLKVAVIGCGGIANQKHFPALKNNSDMNEIVAFCDVIEERAVKAAKEFGTPDAKVYTDYRELLKDESIEVVHICTPNVSHSEIAIAAFEAKKNVYCEKPMSHSTEEAEKMVEAWKESGMQFTVGYQNRFRPEVQNLHAACEKGDLGEIYYGKAHAVRRRGVPTWGVFMDKEAQGGGPLIDIGTHALDITLWCMNNYDIDSVTGSVFYKLGGLQQATEGNLFGPWDPKTYEVEDSAMGFIKMKNGATINLEASWDEALAQGVPVEILEMAKEMRLNGVPQDEAVRKLAEAGATGPAFAALQGMYGFVQFRKDCKAELEGLKEIMPYCFHMHGKCHYVSEDLKEASIPYNEIMPVIQNSDFDGYIVTEYEDHNSGNAEIMTRRHVAMMKKLLGR